VVARAGRDPRPRHRHERLRGWTRLGAHLYNLAHTTLLPAVMLGIGYWQADRLLMALALIWLAHIGLDRLLGMGLKYNDRFTHTHLGDRPDVR
jgi:hypothetical protein